jgi:hypothetical protein
MGKEEPSLAEHSCGGVSRWKGHGSSAEPVPTCASNYAVTRSTHIICSAPGPECHSARRARILQSIRQSRLRPEQHSPARISLNLASLRRLPVLRGSLGPRTTSSKTRYAPDSDCLSLRVSSLEQISASAPALLQDLREVGMTD